MTSKSMKKGGGKGGKKKRAIDSDCEDDFINI